MLVVSSDTSAFCFCITTMRHHSTFYPLVTIHEHIMIFAFCLMNTTLANGVRFIGGTTCLAFAVDVKVLIMEGVASICYTTFAIGANVLVVITCSALAVLFEVLFSAGVASRIITTSAT